MRSAVRLLIVGLIAWLSSVIGVTGASSNSSAVALALGEGIPYALYHDASASLSPEDIMALPGDAFDRRTMPLSEGYRSGAFWLKFDVPAELLGDGPYWLAAFPPFLDDVGLYWREPSVDGWSELRLGDRYPALERPINHRYLVFPLPAEALAGSRTLLLRIETASSVLLEASIWQPEAFVSASEKATAFWSFYFGLALVTVFLVAGLALALKSTLLLSVTLFGVNYLFVASIQGFTGWLLFPASPGLVDALTGISFFLTHLTIIWVGRQAFELSRYFPLLDRLLAWVMLILLILIISIPLGFYGFATLVANVLSEISRLSLIVAGLYLWRQQGLKYGLIALGFALLSAATFLSVLTVSGIIELKADLYLLWQFLMMGLMFLVCALTVHQVWKENQSRLKGEKLETELALARRTSERQRRFLSLVSHEIRTPLAVMTTAANNLRQSPDADPGTIKNRSERLLRASRRLTMLTNNCLTHDRLIDQPLEPVVMSFQMGALIADAADLVDLMDDYELEVSTDSHGSISPDEMLSREVSGDLALLRIALSNLVDNAIKYGKPGIIQLRLGLNESDWTLNVINQGGMAKTTRLDRLFEAFSRETQETDRPLSAGVGLGLYISRLIARAHGGNLWLVTGDAAVTHFVLQIPRSPVKQHQEVF